MRLYKVMIHDDDDDEEDKWQRHFDTADDLVKWLHDNDYIDDEEASWIDGNSYARGDTKEALEDFAYWEGALHTIDDLLDDMGIGEDNMPTLNDSFAIDAKKKANKTEKNANHRGIVKEGGKYTIVSVKRPEYSHGKHNSKKGAYTQLKAMWANAPKRTMHYRSSTGKTTEK